MVLKGYLRLKTIRSYTSNDLLFIYELVSVKAPSSVEEAILLDCRYPLKPIIVVRKEIVI